MQAAGIRLQPVLARLPRKCLFRCADPWFGKTPGDHGQLSDRAGAEANGSRFATTTGGILKIPESALAVIHTPDLQVELLIRRADAAEDTLLAVRHRQQSDRPDEAPPPRPRA